MRNLFLITASLSATLLALGCASKDKAKVLPKHATPGATQAPRVASTERATGDIREALLHLRRVHFAYDTDALLPEGRTALQEAAERLREKPKVHIYIDGHTDDRGTTEYNLALGEKRAHAVSEYLVRLGIDSNRLHVVTFGKEQPWVPGKSAVAQAKNRRAEFRLIRGDVRLVVDDGVFYNDKGKRLTASHF